MNKIIVYCELDFKTQEINDVSYQLISKAHKLKLQANNLKNDENVIVEAVVLGENLGQNSIDNVRKYGADRLTFIKENCLLNFDQIIYSQVFLEYFKKNPSDIILFGATAKGRILAPRITTALETGLVADCTELEMILKNDNLILASTRPTFGSELMATILSRKNPQCATVRGGIFKKEENETNIFEYSVFIPNAYNESRKRLVNSLLNSEKNPNNLQEANIVLCAGYGIYSADKQYYEKLKEIALKTNTTFATTRKVVDYKISDHTKQIGQTGQNVNADVYIGFGVSGALQHISGMKNCRTIIAVNNDENAKIFNYCDYKIIADAKAIIDEMYELIK